MIKKIYLRIYKLFSNKEKYIRKQYKFRLNRTDCDLQSPASYNDKCNYRKLFYKNKLINVACNKHLMKKFVEYVAGINYINPSLLLKNKLNVNDFENMPEKIVIKTTNSSGGNSVIVVHDKKLADLNNIIKKINKAKNVDYGKKTLESWYSKTKNQIIVEKLLGENGILPIEYKVYAFRKEFKNRFIVRVIKRVGNEKYDCFYDENWNKIDLIYNKNINLDFEKPDFLKELLEVSQKFLMYFSHVRVDFFRTKRLIINELTFADTNCFIDFKPVENDIKLGELWNYYEKD